MDPLSTHALCLGYRGRVVLRDVSICLPAGSCTHLLARNGAGKTTLLRGLAGLIPPLGGEIRLLGASVERWSLAARARRGLAAWLERTRLVPQLTVGQNLDLVGARRSEVGPGVARLWDRAPASLSTGQEARVCWVRMRCQRPRVAILDEPFRGLDASGRSWARAQLGALVAHGCAILLTSHHPVPGARTMELPGTDAR